MASADEWLQTLMDPRVQATWETDARGVAVTDAPGWRAHTGQSLDRWQSEGWPGAVHPDERAEAQRQWREALAQGARLDAEFRFRRGDGWQRARVRVAPVRGAGGAIARWLGLAIGVSERDRALERYQSEPGASPGAFWASEERLRSIVRSATDFAILTLGPDRTVTSWSPGAVAIFGYTGPEIVGRPADLLFTPEDRASGAPEREAEQARRVGRAEDERWHLRKDGSRFYASGVLSLLEPEGFVKVARDLTERKEMEDALREARDRLAEKVAERTAELMAEVREHVRTESERSLLLRRLITAQEDERRRLARDLHDQTGQMFAGLSLALRAVADGGSLPPRAAEQLTAAQRLADEIGRQVHELAVRLRPSALDDLGLLAALNELAGRWSAQAGVALDLQTVGLGDERLSSEIETVIYRVVQEALTNVAKHAQARLVSVTVTVSPSDDTTVVIEDDGCGFDLEAVGGSRLGLVGMRERVTLVGGKLEIESSPAGGTTILVRLPSHLDSPRPAALPR